jgi:hypothetical protein
MNADGFVFDQEIMAQFVNAGLRIAEIPVPTRYFAEASSASLVQSTRYGFAILRVLVQFALHRSGMIRQRRFDGLSRPSASGEGTVRGAVPSPPARSRT